jgi:septum formation protein
MFKNIKESLRQQKYVLVLASSSPRRRVLLKKLKVPFLTRTPKSKEHFSGKNIHRELLENTLAKARSISAPRRALIIAGDTVIVYNSRVLGKPRNRAEAQRFLNLLRGQTHKVLTGVVIYDNVSRKIRSGVVGTKVTFRDLSAEEIKKYLDTGEYKDKAGAYGIQGHGGLLIKKIDGNYENVVGLPMNTVAALLKKACTTLSPILGSSIRGRD